MTHSENLGAWKARKREQGQRFIAMFPELQLSSWGDFGTRFALGLVSGRFEVVIGQLARDDLGQPHIDRSDEEVLKALIAAKAKAVAA